MTKGVAIRRPSMPRFASMSLSSHSMNISTKFWIPLGMTSTLRVAAKTTTATMIMVSQDI